MLQEPRRRRNGAATAQAAAQFSGVLPLVFENRFNPMLSVPREVFVSQLTQGIPPPPAEMASILSANLRGPAPAAVTA